MSDRLPYQYVVLRCVPRVDREEFVNIGVVLHCEAAGFLDAAGHVREGAVRALAPDADIDGVRVALDGIRAVCHGEAGPGRPDLPTPGRRFGWIAAPRSTVLQPGPVHSGMTSDPAATLAELVGCYVG